MAADDAADIVAGALRISRRDPDRAADVEDGLYWLNDIHRAVLGDATPWSFLEVTGQVVLTAGVQVYTFASLASAIGASSGVERVTGLVNDTLGGPPLRGMGWPTFERFAYSSQDDPRGVPVVFTQVGLGTEAPELMVYPVPDRAYTMGVVARLAVPVLAAADFTLFPRGHAKAVCVPYIASRIWNQQAGPQAASEAAMHMAAHERAVRRLTEAYGSARMEDAVLVEPTLMDDLTGGFGGW